MIIIKIWQARDKRGLSLRELANMTGICKSTLSNIENGVYSPTLDKLEKIANALEVDITDLFETR